MAARHERRRRANWAGIDNGLGSTTLCLVVMVLRPWVLEEDVCARVVEETTVGDGMVMVKDDGYREGGMAG
ncbi:hypothetical protein M0R45_016050 [Rubus argutus]|uniref:Uncharacterized protein n=1 Tax=Rubus argutus TaxID=59490 RepID=A0AAW1XRI3_RUBAR